MATDINRINIIGRLTRDAELRYAPSGTAVANFDIACNKTFSQSGEKKEQVSYFPCLAWGKAGELITEYCKKGHRIAIEGRLQQRKWEDNDGNKKSKIEIVVEGFQFLNNKTESSSRDQDKGASGMGTSASDPSWDDANPFNDDDIAF